MLEDLQRLSPFGGDLGHSQVGTSQFGPERVDSDKNLRDLLVGQAPFQIEEQVDWPPPPADLDRFGPQNRRQGSQPLLAVEKQLCRLVWILLLLDREIPERDRLVCFPDEDRPGWVAAVKRVHEIADPG